MSGIVVVGSLNLDTTVRVPRLPVPGETVLGLGHFSDAGGKGANQAVAAGRLGSQVAMIGAVGADTAGDRLKFNLDAAGVDVGAVHVDPERPTGIAVISVDEEGENLIVVSPGANASLFPEHLSRHSQMLGEAAVVLAQLEVPVETVAAAAASARGRVLINPAPARDLPDELVDRADVLIPNQTELGMLAGVPTPHTRDESADAARTLDGDVVVTLGADGALVVAGGDVTHVPALEVKAVDPTAAGDAFCGGLADAIAGGADLVEAARWAVRCGAVTVTRWGAQAALPTRVEVEELT